MGIVRKRWGICVRGLGAWALAGLLLSLTATAAAQEDPATCFEQCTNAGGSIVECSEGCGYNLEQQPPPEQNPAAQCFDECTEAGYSIQDCQAQCGYNIE